MTTLEMRFYDTIIKELPKIRKALQIISYETMGDFDENGDAKEYNTDKKKHYESKK